MLICHFQVCRLRFVEGSNDQWMKKEKGLGKMPNLRIACRPIIPNFAEIHTKCGKHGYKQPFDRQCSTPFTVHI